MKKWFVLFLLFFSLNAAAAHAATLSGRVMDETNSPVPQARVLILGLQRGVTTEKDGSYKLENLPANTYTVEVSRLGFGTAVKKVDLSKGDQTLDISLMASPLTGSTITITAKPEASSILSTPASVSVVEGRKLDRERAQSVISSIQDQPGVNMIGEGPTVVKPVIRGLNSQEIVVVEDGIRSESLQWGNEHAPEIDPLGTTRIEVMRGPNSLLYGSDALGGVISITHPDLPNAHLGDGTLSGKFSACADSNNDCIGQNFEASGAMEDWGYRANLSQIHSDNFHNPLEGEVPNTGDQEISGNVAAGVREDWGNLSVDYGHFWKRVELQNPDEPGFPTVPLSDLEYQILVHDHAAIHSTVNTDPARLEFTLGFDEANRSEFDQPSAPIDDPHLHWIESNYTLDAKAHLAPMGSFQGTIGISGLSRNEQSLGLVHLTPSYNQSGLGAYLIEELPLGKFDFTAGVRGDWDQYNIEADDSIGIDPDNDLDDPHPVAAQTLKYSALSAAFGGVYHITDPLAVAVNLGRGYRNPIPFELFAYGVHEGAAEFRIGNPNLTPETSFNMDASLRWQSQQVKAEVGVFRNYLYDYIYGTFTGGTIVGLPVTQMVQGDARVEGVDGSIAVAATNWLTLKGVYNLVRGYNDSNDASLPSEYLPHMPADNVLFGADIHEKALGIIANPYFSLDAKVTAAQDRLGPNEIPSAGYTLWDLHTGGEILVGNNRLAVDIGVTNMFNVGYIDFNSILKPYNIENPGRSIYAKVSIPLGS